MKSVEMLTCYLHEYHYPVPTAGFCIQNHQMTDILFLRQYGISSDQIFEIGIKKVISLPIKMFKRFFNNV